MFRRTSPFFETYLEWLCRHGFSVQEMPPPWQPGNVFTRHAPSTWFWLPLPGRGSRDIIATVYLDDDVWRGSIEVFRDWRGRYGGIRLEHLEDDEDHARAIDAQAACIDYMLDRWPEAMKEMLDQCRDHPGTPLYRKISIESLLWSLEPAQNWGV
jgi:hypothetical protein